MDEMQLAHQAAQGDTEAFRILIQRYRNYIYTIAYRIVLREEDALDVTQQVYLRLVEHIVDFDGRGAFRGWVGSIAAREAISFRRRAVQREIPTNPEDMNTLVESHSADCPPAPDARERMVRAERRRHVEDAMAVLSPQQRAIFALRFHEDVGPREIAERLGIADKQVRSQLHRALATLRRVLQQKGCLE